MASTTTFKALIEALSEETATGYVLPTVTGTTSQLTLANAYGAGPFLAQRFPRGSAILTTAGTAINEVTFVDTYTPSTGVITTTPSPSGTYTDAVLFPFGTGIDHPDRVKEAINRALTRRCKRLTKVPFTQAGGGMDLLGTTADWATVTATLTYSDGDDLGYHTYRVMVVAATAANGYAANYYMRVQPTDVVDFFCPVEAYTPNTAKLVIWDVSNGSAITPTYTEGSATISVSRPTNVRGYFTVPTNCQLVEYRCTVPTISTSAAFGPVAAVIRGSRELLVSAFVTAEQIGNFYVKQFADADSVAGYGETFRQYNVGHTLDNRGYSTAVVFDDAPPFPLYYDAYVSPSALSAMTDTTTVPSDRVLTWAKYELRKMLYEREPDPEKKRQAKVLAMEAKKSADAYEFHTTDIVTVAGRR